MNSNSKRIMAIDYGEKRVGIASTDETGQFALPRRVLANDARLLESVLEFRNHNKIDLVILGESKNFEGRPNPIQEKIAKFKNDLEELGMETVFHPEVMTTLEARRLQGNGEMTDASAAALILKSFLDTMYNKR